MPLTSLTGIRDAINKADTGMTASIIKTGDGSYRLSLTSDKTGEDNAATISVTGDSAIQGLLAYDGTLAVMSRRALPLRMPC